ncbi:hypothetical protein Taro_010365, partial [Colocasia esculenta]|nr:hypothetical protein [Colocasia esculenta]
LCENPTLCKLGSDLLKLFLAIYHDKELAEVKEETSPTSSWSHLHPRTRRRAIVELLGTAQGELLWPFRSPWLREVGVAERRPVRTSRDVTSGRSSRPRHCKVLYFPHRRLWIMEYSCKVWCKPCRHRLLPRQHSRHSWRLRLVAFDHRTLDEALSAACRQEGEMEQYLEEKKASQKRPLATFQRQDKKKAVYPTQQ